MPRAWAERRSINARVTAKPPLATALPPLNQRRNNSGFRFSNARVFDFPLNFVRGDERCRNLTHLHTVQGPLQQSSGGVTGP